MPRIASGIREIRDLIDAEIVLRTYSVEKDDLELEYLKPGLAIQRIREGRLDAFFIVAGYPSQAITDLARDTDIALLPIDGPEAKELVSEYRFFSHSHVPEGIYPGVGRTDTISVGAQWLVRSSVDEELVYQITRSLWNKDSRRLLDTGHAKGRHIQLQTALDGITVPLHPGSRRFYAEVGLAGE